MKRVGILAIEGSPGVAVTGPMDVLNDASLVWSELNGATNGSFFEVEILSEGVNPVRGMNGYPIHCDRSIDEDLEWDVLIVPPLRGDIPAFLASHRRLAEWLRDQYTRGAEVASLCTGAFLVASTGILDGGSVATHWYFAPLFREMFPEVGLEIDQMVIDNDGIYSCGGAFTFLNLVIYLVEKFCGHEVAVVLSKRMLIDRDKDPQSSYVIFSGQKHHGDEPILAAQEYIEENYALKLTTRDLADAAHMSARNFARRFKRATGNTPTQYLQRVRVEAVKRGLETSPEPVEQILLRCGYEDPGSFRDVFRRITGITPADYRKKYRRLVT